MLAHLPHPGLPLHPLPLLVSRRREGRALQSGLARTSDGAGSRRAASSCTASRTAAPAPLIAPTAMAQACQGVGCGGGLNPAPRPALPPRQLASSLDRRRWRCRGWGRCAAWEAGRGPGPWGSPRSPWARPARPTPAPHRPMQGWRRRAAGGPGRAPAPAAAAAKRRRSGAARGGALLLAVCAGAPGRDGHHPGRRLPRLCALPAARAGGGGARGGGGGARGGGDGGGCHRNGEDCKNDAGAACRGGPRAGRVLPRCGRRWAPLLQLGKPCGNQAAAPSPAPPR